MEDYIRIQRDSIKTWAKCEGCGEMVFSAYEEDVLEWANAHDTAGGSPDNHRVSITQWAIPVEVKTR